MADSPFLKVAEGIWLWPALQVRGAGFPVAALEKLAARPEEDYPTARRRGSQLLRDWAAHPDFQRAVAWQNPAACRNMLGRLQATPVEASDKTTRKRELVVASYLQRYCAKNDTIGFFGPLGWGEAGPSTEQQPGPQVAGEMRVHWETWAVRQFAQSLAEHPEFQDHFRPRLQPYLSLQGDVLMGDWRARSADQSRALPGWQARLLEQCDGSLRLGELDEAARAFLQEADKRGWVQLTPRIPNHDHSQLWLLEWADQLPPDLQRRFQELWEPLESARLNLAQAPCLMDAQEELQQCFQAATDSPGQRQAGQTYGARLLVYADCNRQGSYQFETDALLSWLRRLQPILQIGSWFVQQLEQRVEDWLERQMQDLTKRVGPRYRASLLYHRSLGIFGSDRNGLLATAREELQRRVNTWLESYDLSGEQVDLQPPPDELFPIKPGSRIHHSVDLLLSEAGPAVLGELHPGVNTHSTLLAARSHPQPEQLAHLFAQDPAAPDRLSPVPLDDLNRCSFDSWLSPEQHHLEVHLAQPSWKNSESVRALSDLWIEEGRLYDARTRHQLPLSCLFGRLLRWHAATHFDPWGRRDHRPRLCLEGLVVARRSWTFGSAELDFAGLETAEQRYQAARRWWAVRQLPERVFLKVNSELKPLYVDGRSPIFVELLSKLARANERVTFSEMSPAPEQCWLRDQQGRRYTSEIRLTVSVRT